MYGGLTPKRHIAWSNARTVQLLDLGVLLKETRDRLSRHGCTMSTKKYISKTGRRGFSGSRFLKQTQSLDWFEGWKGFPTFPKIMDRYGFSIQHNGPFQMKAPSPTAPKHDAQDISALALHSESSSTTIASATAGSVYLRSVLTMQAWMQWIVFALLSWEEVDSWSDGNLIAVVYYLRGSTNYLSLKIGGNTFQFPFPFDTVSWKTWTSEITIGLLTKNTCTFIDFWFRKGVGQLNGAWFQASLLLT